MLESLEKRKGESMMQEELLLGRMICCMLKKKERNLAVRFVAINPDMDEEHSFLKLFRDEFSEELSQCFRQHIHFYYPNEEGDITEQRWNRASRDIPAFCWGMRIKQKGVLPFGVRMKNKYVIFFAGQKERKKEERQR